MKRSEKIKFLTEVQLGKRKIKGDLILVFNREPGVYEVNGKKLNKEQFEKISKRYERVLMLTRTAPEEIVKHWRGCGMTEEAIREKLSRDYPTADANKLLSHEPEGKN